MNRELFPTHTSLLQCGALVTQVLSNYALPPPLRCHFYRQGLNDSYRITAGGDIYFLRVYRYGWRTQAQIAAELLWLQDLHQRGLPVSRPIPQKDSRLVQEIHTAEGTRYAVLFTAAPGILRTHLNADQSRLLGQITAHLHNAADDWTQPLDRPHFDIDYLLGRPLHHIRTVWQHLEREMAFLDKLARRLETWLAERALDPPEWGLCHGDLHSENAHFAADDSPTLYDFDCCGYGSRIYDMATFTWSRYLFAHSAANRERTQLAFVTGYEAERTLPADTLPALPYFMTMRQLWGMGIHASPVTGHYGRRWLDDRYVAKHFGLLHTLVDSYGLL